MPFASPTEISPLRWSREPEVERTAGSRKRWAVVEPKQRCLTRTNGAGRMVASLPFLGYDSTTTTELSKLAPLTFLKRL
jgi:hypothetical protein